MRSPCPSVRPSPFLQTSTRPTHYWRLNRVVGLPWYSVLEFYIKICRSSKRFVNIDIVSENALVEVRKKRHGLIQLLHCFFTAVRIKFHNKIRCTVLTYWGSSSLAVYRLQIGFSKSPGNE